jgi:branched-chain amino acid transport system permease protein
VIPFLLAAATYVAIQGILALGLNIEWGLSGLLNLSYIMFMAAGAYLSAVVTSPPATPPGVEYILGTNAPFLVGVLAGAAGATALAFVTGAIALRRLSADYFAIVTLVIADAVLQVVSQFRNLFNGSSGMIAIPQPLGSVFTTRGYAVFYLLMCCAFLAGCFVISEWVRKSPFGRALRAAREDELAAASFGRNAYWLKLRAFVLGGAMAGLAGALLGAYVTAFAPAGWQVSETLLVLVCLFVGGSGNNVGAIVGTALVIGLLGQLPQLLPVSLSNPDLVPDLRFMALGLLIILFLKWRPEGLIPERASTLVKPDSHPHQPLGWPVSLLRRGGQA